MPLLALRSRRHRAALDAPVRGALDEASDVHALQPLDDHVQSAVAEHDLAHPREHPDLVQVLEVGRLHAAVALVGAGTLKLRVGHDPASSRETLRTRELSRGR